jgi:hypothetical protein
MRHYRYVIDELSVSGREMNDVGGSVVVAEFEGRQGIDWELVVRTTSGTAIEMAAHTLEMDGPEGHLSGPALLVRSDGTSHVFRGAGKLVGFRGFPFDPT